MLLWKLAAWWVAVGCYVAAVWVWHLFSAEDLASPSAAAWVQAVGSVAAILVAVAVPALQHRRDKQEQIDRERAEHRRVVEMIRSCLSDLQRVVDNEETVEQRRVNLEPGVPPREYHFARAQLDVIEAALSGFVAADMPNATVLSLLQAARRRCVAVRFFVRVERTRAGDATPHVTLDDWRHHQAKIEAVLLQLDTEIAGL